MTMSRQLRQDLELMETAPYEDGSPRWRLYDRVTNRFFDIGWLEVEILRELRSNPDPELDSASLAGIVANRANVICNSRQVDEFLEFLEKSGLFWTDGEQALEARKKLRESKVRKFLIHLAKQYLFLRIPLLHPHKLLDQLLPFVTWAFKPLTWWIILFNTLLAVWLTSRQLDYFLNTAISYFTPTGLLYFSLAIIIAKIMHEFGHALTARHYGCSVRAMGVVLLVFWPVLYTDATDAWRLRSRKQRAMIGVAGILVELGIASVCLLLWNFMPDGFLRTILFMLSTTTWIMTLVINFNPLMRFDGHYVLSDLTGVENLQTRSNAMGRWWLRERLWGYGVRAPEEGRRWLIPFAYTAWMWLLFVFISISYVIYAFFFKALGIVVAAIQITRLILLPVSKELRFWWKHRAAVSGYHVRRTAGVVAVALLLFAVPIDNELELPAYWQARDVVTLYAPISGRVHSFPEPYDSRVGAGETVAIIRSPDLEFGLGQADHDVRSGKYQLERTGVNVGLARDRLALEAELTGALQKQKDIRALLDDAHLHAPFDASITDLQVDLRVGDWVRKGENLVTLTNNTSGEIIAYLGESELAALHDGAVGRFYPEGGARLPIPVRLVDIEGFALEQLEELYVASRYGGGLDVRDGMNRNLIPQRATYRIRLETAAPTTDRVLRGQLAIEAEERSLLALVWRQVLGIFRREAGV